MIDRHPPAAMGRDAEDAWIERLLTTSAADDSYVADDGFTARVLADLPSRQVTSRTRWIVPLMSVLGFLVGLGLLSGGTNLSGQLAELASLDSYSMRAWATVVLPLALLYWLAVGAAIQQE